ncbi:hypothetical protein C8R45DRAFT_1163678 [Mycena sanguinolenta]|nr:hypothetical protein C8R45DRAFT_1163678 [Mycena sanguinolenta]
MDRSLWKKQHRRWIVAICDGFHLIGFCVGSANFLCHRERSPSIHSGTGVVNTPYAQDRQVAIGMNASDYEIPTIHAFFYLNALFVLFVVRFTLAARPNDRRQEAPTSECTGSTTVYSTATSTTTSTSTDWVTITLTSTVYSTVTATATDTFTSTATDTITSTATDTITLTSTDTVTVTESASTTISATSTTTTDTETPTAPPTSTTTSTSTPPSTTSTCDTATATPVTSWTYLGCYTDSVSSRTLSAVQKGNIANNSVASCQATCLAAGQSIALRHLSVQSWCFCDSSIRAGVKLGGTCNTACSGGVGSCGGTDAIDIYKAVTAPCVTPWKFRGCFTDATSRTLSAVQIGGIANNSVAGCQATCLAAGYDYAGVEYASWCFCDSSILASAKAASLANCQDACTSGVGACGGTWFISIYEAV